MKPTLKPIKDQVIVITGASSGIGLATSLEAARRGARVVLVSRNGEDLKTIVKKIQTEGGQAASFVADVADDAQVQKAAAFAIETFGGFDTWVNNAGVSIYGRLTDAPLDEKRRVFDVNFWGSVHGCKAAVRHLKERGGAIINVGSEVSEHPIPLQGIYAASKHALKAYNDVLRMELEQEGAPISVTLIKPAAVNTPYTAHAASHMKESPELPPPVYAPEVVARAIIACSERPIPSLFVGGSGALVVLLQKFLPRMTELVTEHFYFDKQKARLPKRRDEGLMKAPRREGEIYGDSPYRMRRSSLYTTAALHPVATGLVAVGVGAIAYGGIRRLRQTTVSEGVLG